MQYGFRIEAEILKRQPDENIRSYVHRIKTLVDKEWLRPSDAVANAQKACGNQRIGKYRDFFKDGLTPPRFKQKAYQALIKVPNKTCDPSQTLITNKDTSLEFSAEMSCLQQKSSRTSADSTNSRFTNLEKTLNELTNMVKSHQINATYDPKNPKMKKHFTRFFTYCKKSGHKVKVCWSLKKPTEEKTPA